jgi:hypothetical protein
MADKDLGEMTENFEAEVENLKNTKMKLFGITVTPTTIMGALTLVGALLGTLYGAFESYKAFQEMAEKLETLDLEAVEARNVAIETKLNDAIDYTRDIKDGLREDVMQMEALVERLEDKVDKSEDRVKDAQDAIETHLEAVRGEMNQVQKDVTASIREVEGVIRESEKDVRTTMRETEDRLDADMEKLEVDLNKKLQEALNNPLNNM